MDEALISQREEELRKMYPDSFSYPGLQPGEICISKQVIDVVYLNVEIYRQRGLSTARVGPKGEMNEPEGRNREIVYLPIFANLRESIELEFAQNQNRST